MKTAVAAASTGNLTLYGLQTVDGVALVAGDRVLVKDQNASAYNGIYTVYAGAWSRSADSASWLSLVGATVVATGGASYQGALFLCTVAALGTLGSDPVTWAQAASETSQLAMVDVSTGSTVFLRVSDGVLQVGS